MRNVFKQKTAKDLFTVEKEQWVTEARAVAHRLLKKWHSITIEDVTTITPVPTYLNPSIKGLVFNSEEFVRMGYERNRRPESHGNLIGVWRAKTDSDREAEREEETQLPMNWRMRRTAEVQE